MALFITFEGGEGCGKTTQAEILKNSLRRQKKWGVLNIAEPGTTLFGKRIREWLKHKDRPLMIIPGSGTQLDLFEKENGHDGLPIIKINIDSPREELLAFTLARSQLVEEVIIPNLTGKNIIICNRFADSTMAYQGYGRGLDLELVKVANRIATQGIKPDLTILLDIPPEIGLARKFGDDRNKFEKEEFDFHKRVRGGYLKLAAAEPDRWFVLDALRPVNEIQEAIWTKVRRLITTKETESKLIQSDSELSATVIQSQTCA